MADNVEMQGIEFEIVNDSAAASAGVETLSKKLAELKTAISGSTTALSKVAAGITGIKNAVSGVKTSNFESQMSRISASLAKLKAQTDNLKISSSIGNQLTEIGKAVRDIPDGSGSKLTQLAEGLTPLSTLGKASISSFITQLGKVPTVVESLGKTDMTKFSQQMKDLASAMKPLADEMNKVAAGFSAFPSRIQKLIANTEQFGGTIQRATGQTNLLWKSLKGAVAFTLYRKAYTGLASMLNTASKYTETINLFTASMGEYAKEAYDFAKKASDVMGIDIADWMQNQGVFNTIITGFGVSGEKAAFMSKNLTQLGYDLASFYNIDVASAMQKVQAGISGELEPLRRLGYDLSAAKLQEEAAALGISKKVSAMDQAEKSMLRYHAIMTQVTVAQGDMARTLEAPANQLRVLRSQVNLAAREIGNIFIPALNAILPYTIAAVKAIRALAVSIANLFGVQLASVDYSGISGAGSAAEKLDKDLSSAGGSAAELKNQLAGFDELNVIQSASGGGIGGVGGIGSGELEDIELPGYDFIKDAVSTKVDKIYNKIKPLIDWTSEHLQEIGMTVGTIGATMLAWEISTNLANALSWTKGTLDSVHGVLLALGSSVITIGVSFLLEKKGLAGTATENWGDLIASWISSAAGSAITGGVATKFLGKTAGKYAAGVTLAISAATSIKAIFDDVNADGFDGKTLADSIWTALKGAAAGGLFALAAGASLAVGASIGAGLTLAGIGIAVALANVELDTRETRWGNLELTKEQITKYVQEQLFSIDVTATIGAIDSVISDLDSQKGKLNAAISEFNNGLTLVKLGVDKEGSYQKMLTALTGGAADGSYSADSILGQLKSVTEQSSVAVKLGFSTLVGDSSADIGKLLDTSDAIIQAETQRIGKELADLLTKGVNEGLDANEQEMAIELSDTLSRIAQVATQENINTEFLGNLAFSLADMDQGSFDSVMEQFATLKAQLREQYQSLAITTLAGMKSHYATLLEIGTPEALAKAAELKAEIDEFANNMTAYVDEAVERVSGQGAEMIAARVREAFSEAITIDDLIGGISIEEALENSFVKFTDETPLEEIVDYIDNYVMETFQAVLPKEDYNLLKEVAEATGASYLSMLPEGVQSGFQTAWSAVLGDRTTEVFEALGYDSGNTYAAGFIGETTNIGGNVIDGLHQNDWAGAGAADGMAYANSFSATAGAIRFPALTTPSFTPRAVMRNVRGYATGGYPKSGELFLARENGSPEMVGKMGGNTAVANNEQIVTGISSGVSKGVSDANREQNALLREQNDLLRRLLQKEFTAEVSPSAEFGRVVAKSSRMYEKVYG
jgi:prefoldin subunit 5